MSKNIARRICEIMMEANQIKESALREKLLQEGYNPNEITANIKDLPDYPNIVFYPIMEVIDYNIILNGGIPPMDEEED